MDQINTWPHFSTSQTLMTFFSQALKGQFHKKSVLIALYSIVRPFHFFVQHQMITNFCSSGYGCKQTVHCTVHTKCWNWQYNVFRIVRQLYLTTVRWKKCNTSFHSLVSSRTNFICVQQSYFCHNTVPLSSEYKS